MARQVIVTVTRKKLHEIFEYCRKQTHAVLSTDTVAVHLIVAVYAVFIAEFAHRFQTPCIIKMNGKLTCAGVGTVSRLDATTYGDWGQRFAGGNSDNNKYI